MAYADPQSTHNPATGEIPPAAWGDIVRDDLEYLARNRPHCRVYNSAAISLTHNTDAALTFNSERYDVGGCHSTASNTSRITIPAGEGGKYLLTGHVEFASNATGDRQLSFRLNGTTVLAAQRVGANGSSVTILSLSTVYALAAGDYVELWALQSSGGALNATASGNYSPEFSAMWMAV